jgi:hypothetical protein
VWNYNAIFVAEVPYCYWPEMRKNVLRVWVVVVRKLHGTKFGRVVVLLLFASMTWSNSALVAIHQKMLL